jgi:SOS response regulatory protein OraA/RecX
VVNSPETPEPDDRSGAADRRAYNEALQLLARRPRSSSELRDALRAKGHAAETIATLLERLTRAGQIDDLQLAKHYILTRTERLGHGKDRLLRELRGRGIEREDAERAWSEVADDLAWGPQELLRREARRRVAGCAGRLDRKSYRRVYNALLRAGHDADRITAELAAYRAFSDSDDEPSANGTDDDFA